MKITTSTISEMVNGEAVVQEVDRVRIIVDEDNYLDIQTSKHDRGISVRHGYRNLSHIVIKPVVGNEIAVIVEEG